MSDVSSPKAVEFPKEQSALLAVLFRERFFKLPTAEEPEIILEGDANGNYNRIDHEMELQYRHAEFTSRYNNSDQFTLRIFEPTQEGINQFNKNREKVAQTLQELPRKVFFVMRKLWSIYRALGDEFIDRNDPDGWKLKVAEWGRRHVAHIYVFKDEMMATKGNVYPLFWNGAYINTIYNEMYLATPSKHNVDLNDPYLPIPQWNRFYNRFDFVMRQEYRKNVTPTTDPNAYFRLQHTKAKLKIPSFKSADARLEAYMQITQ